jgi:PAS domain S-box-containing protein
LIGFGFAALFAVGAAAMGLSAFSAVERAQVSLLDDRLPTVELAQTLAHQTQAVAAAAPQLLVAESSAERRSASTRLENQLRILDGQLDTLRPRLSDPEFLTTLENQRADMGDALTALNHWVESRITSGQILSARLEETHAEIGELRDAIARWLETLAAGGHDPALDKDLNAAALAVESAQTALAALPSVQGTRLRDVEMAYRGALATIDTRLAKLPPGETSRHAITYLEWLTRGASFSDNVFALRAREAEAVRRSKSLLVAYTQFANRLVYSASALAEETSGQMQAASQDLAQDLRDSGAALLAIATLSVVGALLLALFVDRTISGRLSALRRTMASHAAGIQSPIPDFPDDEIGDMAEALKVFLATISDRERALQASEDHLRAVIDAVPEGILTVDLDGVIQSASRSTERLVGLDRGLVGVPLTRLALPPPPPPGPHPRAALPAEDGPPSPVTPARLSDAARAKKSVPIALRQPDGSVIPADMTVDGIIRDDRRLYVVTLRDTSERRRTEEEREHFLALLGAAQEATADGLMISDLVGAIISTNRKFYQVFGLSADILAALPRTERIRRVAAMTADPKAFEDRIWQVDKDRDLVAFDMVRMADGRQLERYSAPFRVAGEIAGRVWSVRDITERERSRAELTRAKEAAEQALQDLRDAQRNLVEAEKMAALGQLVAGVAHEINTPVGITVTAASHIADEARSIRALVEKGEMRRSRFLDFLKVIGEASDLLLSNANRAAELIQGFKQVAVDQTSDERRRFDLAQYAHEVLVSLGPRLRKSPHALTSTFPPDIAMDGYPGALSQVLTNLILNALTHAFGPEDSGELRVEARALPDDRVELTVADNGHGMTPEVQAQVFEPFFTTRRGLGGSGLGLHIVYNLVTRTLGGRVRVDSAPGQGTTFTVTIPRIAPRIVSIVQQTRDAEAIGSGKDTRRDGDRRAATASEEAPTTAAEAPSALS